MVTADGDGAIEQEKNHHSSIENLYSKVRLFRDLAHVTQTGLSDFLEIAR